MVKLSFLAPRIIGGQYCVYFLSMIEWLHTLQPWTSICQFPCSNASILSFIDGVFLLCDATIKMHTAYHCNLRVGQHIKVAGHACDVSFTEEKRECDFDFLLLMLLVTTVLLFSCHLIISIKNYMNYINYSC